MPDLGMMGDGDNDTNTVLLVEETEKKIKKERKNHDLKKKCS